MGGSEGQRPICAEVMPPERGTRGVVCGSLYSYGACATLWLEMIIDAWGTRLCGLGERGQTEGVLRREGEPEP